jgi:(p)ppGpp synthase/HD superfamily hydrolase
MFAVRLAIKVAVAVTLVSVGALILVRMLSIGAQWYQRKELDEHRRYLEALLARKLSISQVEAELREEPIRVVKPADATSISQVWTDPRNSAAEVEAKVSKWPETRIYRKSPMIYFIYFDSEGQMRDFSCLAS